MKLRRSRTRALIPLVLLLPVLGFLAGCAQTPEQKYARSLDRGKKLLERQESARAILEFSNAIREQPEEAEAYFWIAQAFLGRNQMREAIASLRRAVDINPNYSAAQLKLAELMIRSKDEELLKDAEARVQKVLTDNPGDEDALFTLAATQAQLGRVEEAEKYLNEALLRSPSHLRAGIALALVKISQNDLPAAEQILKKAVEQAPNSADAAVALGTVYSSMNRLAEAETVLMRAVALNEDFTEAWLALGSVQLQMGKKPAAEQSYKRAATSPKSRAPLAYVVFLIRQERRRNATTELERMFQENPNNRIARSALVAIYMAANRNPEAETILNEVLNKNPRDVEALLQRAQIYLQKRRFEDAHADVDRVLGVQASAQAYYLRSRVFWVKGDELKRRQDLDQALRLAPDSLRVRIELADAELRANRAKIALRVLDEAPPHQKRSLAFAIGYGWALIGYGDAPLARKIVDQALTAFKSDPELLLQDAVLRLAARDYTGARRSVEQVLAANAEELRAVNVLAHSYSGQNQRSTATERIRKMVQDHPKSLRLQLFWAQWLLEDNKRAEARKALADAAAADPKSPEPLFLSAGLDFNERQFASARNTLKLLFRLDEKHVNAHVLAGQVEEAAGYNRDAMEHYNKAIAVDANNLVALNNLAYMLAHDPTRTEEALAFARRAKELAPDSPQVMDTLGWLYYRKGLYDLAARELEGALAKAEWPSIQLHLGLTYNRLGNTKKGQVLVAAALAKEPKLADMLQ